MSSYIPTNNLSLYSIPAVWLTAFFPVMMKVLSLSSLFLNVDPKHYADSHHRYSERIQQVILRM
jgi:hypothetical protein